MLCLACQDIRTCEINRNLGKKGDSKASRTIADALCNRVTSVMRRVVCQLCVKQEPKHITPMSAHERSQTNGLFLSLCDIFNIFSNDQNVEAQENTATAVWFRQAAASKNEDIVCASN